MSLENCPNCGTAFIKYPCYACGWPQPKRDYEKELANICNGLAESVLEASVQELEEEIRAEGLDPDTEAEKVRDILREAVARHERGVTVVHREFEGEHVFDGSRCWCDPIEVGPNDTRESAEIESEANRSDG